MLQETLLMPDPVVSPEAATPSRRRESFPNWLREPLLHFVVLGAVLFAVDYYLFGRADDPRTIVVDSAVDAGAIQVFRTERNRAPDEAELYALRQIWLDNEVLYREGLALGVDKGDPAIRDRVVFKMLSVVNAGLKRPPFDDQVLRDWFEKNRARYDEPIRLDFQEAVLSGDRSESAVRSLVASLNDGAPADVDAGLRVFRGRPYASIEQSYGPDLAKSLAEAPVGEWRAQSTNAGWRAMRVESVTPAKPAEFERLRGVILQDWTDAIMAEQRTAAVRALAAKYTIKYETAPE
jgi:hypothetical protein